MSATTKNFKHLKYSRSIGKDFESTLKKRVHAYFKENDISKYANFNMKFKRFMSLFMWRKYKTVKEAWNNYK